MSSWSRHGYKSDGTPQKLPSENIQYASQFSHNYPDVKQMGMGGGNHINFAWNMTSPYWRSTMDLYNKAITKPDTYVKEGTVRWDENFGRVGCHSNDAITVDQDKPYTSGTSAYVRGYKRTIRDSYETDNFWIRMPNVADASRSGNTNPFSYGINQYYRDPEPIPSLWLQLQPQLSAITSGVGNSVAQVQFEVRISA